MEEWRKIREFPNYDVSNEGRVQNRLSERYLKFMLNQDGVCLVGLMRDGVQYKRSVALLVASAWIPRPYGPMDTPIHLNGLRTANNVSNLVWRPRWFAVKYNRQFTQPYEYPLNVPIRDCASRIEYVSSWDVCTIFGLLEKDLVLSILNSTYVWPTYQQFELVV